MYVSILNQFTLTCLLPEMRDFFDGQNLRRTPSIGKITISGSKLVPAAD